MTRGQREQFVVAESDLTALVCGVSHAVVTAPGEPSLRDISPSMS